MRRRVWRPVRERGAPSRGVPGIDGFYYFSQGSLIGDGHFFKNGWIYERHGELLESSLHPPGFSLVLGLWSALGFGSVADQVLLLGVVSVATVIAIAVLTRHLAGGRAGLAAAGIASVYPPLWYSVGIFAAEVLYHLAITIVLIAAYRYADAPRLHQIALVGGSNGAASLVRGGKQSSSTQRCSFLSLGVPLTTQRHSSRALCVRGGISLLNDYVMSWSEAVQSFWWSVHGSSTTTLSTTNLRRSRRHPGECSFRVPAIPHGTERGAGMWESHGCTRLDLPDFPAVALARLGRAFSLSRPVQTLKWDWFQNGGPLPYAHHVMLFAYYALSGTALCGASVLRKAKQRLTPLLSMYPVVMIATVSTFGITRYRAPVEIAMVVLGGVGVGHWQRANKLRSWIKVSAGMPRSVVLSIRQRL